MLTRPAISDDTIVACLQDSFRLRALQVAFLPGGYAASAQFRITADGGISYFLKLQSGTWNEIAVAVPAFLRAQGIRQVLAPVPTTTGALWLHRHGFDWILYPFFEGKTGFDRALSPADWVELGRCMKAVHTTLLVAELARRIPREDFAPDRRNAVMATLKRVETERFDDPIAALLAELLLGKRDEIRCMVERAGRLVPGLRKRALVPVLCHADLHGRNVLVGADGAMAVVDWDSPVLAPKERDLMFIGGGVGGIWNSEREVEWFYQGYGRTEVDRVALAYYRYERIVTDIAERCELIFGMRGSVEDRRKGLRLAEQFLPNNVVEIAHRTYRELKSGNQVSKRRNLISDVWREGQ